jgi:hypothetical protein
LLGTVVAAAAFAAGPIGSLTLVPGPSGCIVAPEAPRAISCTRVHELRIDAAIVSPDGRNLYTLGGIDQRSAIAVMRRNPRTGAVRQVGGRAGCLVADWTGRGKFTTCTGARLNKPSTFAMTPDGRELFYLNGAGRYPFNAYKRSPRTGALSVVDCCRAVRGVACASDVTTSPDGRNVYVASVTCTGHGLAVLARDPATGELTQPDGPAGCVQRIAADGCARAPSRSFSPSKVVVTPDGTEVYVAALGGLFVFRRDGSTGTLKARVCYLPKPKRPCHGLAELWSDGGELTDFAFAPDGWNVYFAANNRILVFDRTPSGRLTQVAAPRGCVSATGDGGRCVAAPGLRGFGSDLTLSLDGRSLYLGTEDALSRNPSDGSLTPLPGRFGRSPLRQWIGGSALSPDGRFFYVGTELPVKKPGSDIFGFAVLRRAH